MAVEAHAAGETRPGGEPPTAGEPPVAGGAHAGARFEPPGTDGIGRVVVDRPDDAVNALSLELMESLAAAVRQARQHDGLKGLIVASAKPDQWIAGADLSLVTRAPNAAAIEAASRRFQAICDELAWLPCTTVAAISGAALGGGFEVALACDYRVASDTKAVSVGLPEVSLGLLPAGGGTQRLPRLVGLSRALDLILAGKRMSARRALRAGLVDEVVHPAVLDQAARAWARRPKRSHDRALKLELSVEGAVDLAEQTPQGRRLLYIQAREAVLKRTRGHYPAPLRALDAIAEGLEQGLAAGLDAEARAFGELASGPIARNLIWLFLATQRQKRDTGVADAAVQPKPVRTVGLVGAGFMGAGIAEVAAAAGFRVRLRDVKPEAVARGIASIHKMVEEGAQRRRFDRREARDLLSRVSGTTDWSGFGAADLVIEAVFEDLALKQRVVGEMEAVLRPDAVIATNTSALPVTQIASAAQRPERVVGMHFFSPAHRMPLLEVVRADQSADEAVATAVAVGQRMGKTVIVVRDGPGFYTTRVLGVMMNEAAQLLTEGAEMEAVDQAMTRFGFPVGPFVLFDEVGLEVAQHVGQTLGRAFALRQPQGERGLADASIVDRLVAAGRTGKRSGRGFLNWEAERGRGRLPISVPTPPLPFGAGRKPGRAYDPLVYDLLGNPPRRAVAEEEIQERLSLLFVNEAIRCLEEQVLRSPTDGDLGAVLGVGFPPFLGGPFHYADSLGLAAVRTRLERLAHVHGRRYQPAALLVDRAAKGERFYGTED